MQNHKALSYLNMLKPYFCILDAFDFSYKTKLKIKKLKIDISKLSEFITSMDNLLIPENARRKTRKRRRR